MENNDVIRQLITNAQEAQKSIRYYDQEKADTLVKAIGKVIYDNAEMLAIETVDETMMGVYGDKVFKAREFSKTIWHSLENEKSVGIIKEDRSKGLQYVAKPKGVVAAITPATNPVVTAMCNAMFALKGLNAIIVAPHPRAKKCSSQAVKLMREELKNSGASENLIQIIEEPTMELTQELMKKADVVVATGGMGLVKAAYQSGKPAYGVGAGNVQAIIDREYDFNQAAKDIIAGRKFDNGVLCIGEQCIIAPAEQHAEVMAAFTRNGAHYIADEEMVERFRKVMFVDGNINAKLVGKSVQYIAKAAGAVVPKEAKIVILRARGCGNRDLLCKEKMFPYTATVSYNTFEEAIEIAKSNLLFEGTGHTAAIHSNNKEHIRYAGIALPVSRLVVNQPSTAAGGNFYNGFCPSTTLGCGSWGNNSISENLNFKHLINVTTIGFFNKDAFVPSDYEIWNL